MNRTTVVLAGVLVFVAGCQHVRAVDPNGAVNKALAQSLGDEAIQNAIIRQHTLYPYHFVANAPELNELGRRDLDVLIDHYRRYPGALNIRRGSESEPVYAARVAQVLALMAEAELNAEKVTIADGMPGGEGLASEEVIEIIRPRPAAGPTLTIPTALPGAERKEGY